MPIPPILGAGAQARLRLTDVVERRGRVVARVAHSLKGKAILQFVCSAVIPEGALLITDEHRAYNILR